MPPAGATASASSRPSQAGKSYLVSALARRPLGQLTADFAGCTKDFLTEINPPGDRGSTGLVTRFTAHKSAVEADHPVELRLLSETDVVKILANSFYSDDPNNMTFKLPDEAAIREALTAAQASAAGASRTWTRSPSMTSASIFSATSAPASSRCRASATGTA